MKSISKLINESYSGRSKINVANSDSDPKSPPTKSLYGRSMDKQPDTKFGSKREYTTSIDSNNHNFGKSVIEKGEENNYFNRLKKS